MPRPVRSWIRGHRLLSIAGLLTAIVVAALLLSCASTPPANPDDICEIFAEKSGWYRDSKAAEKRWGTPIHVQMAIIRQESGFRNDAQPPRSTLLGFIPWTRPSSAYGYPQAMDGTWEWYREKTDNPGADRDDFGDAVDFVGWYTDMSKRKLKISSTDAFRQYLAYHEGHGGFRRNSYQDKSWLKAVAQRVDRQSRRYAEQLKSCQDRLDQSWSLWPFS